VLLVTHDLAEAVFLADTLVLLKDGALVQRGSPVELLRRPADEFVARFLKAHRPATGSLA
jgi:osmoprotectant transport system ATP-binding protein